MIKIGMQSEVILKNSNNNEKWNEKKRKKKRDEWRIGCSRLSYSDDGVNRIEQEQEMISWQKKKTVVKAGRGLG